MSVETTEVQMPQPEQWLSEHDPWATIGFVLGALLIAALVGWMA